MCWCDEMSWRCEDLVMSKGSGGMRSGVGCVFHGVAGGLWRSIGTSDGLNGVGSKAIKGKALTLVLSRENGKSRSEL
jgi:hypothetical protein